MIVKKKICLALMACMLMGTMSGCEKIASDKTEESGSAVVESMDTETGAENTEASESGEANDGIALKDVNVEDYVTIGKYKELNIVMQDPGITDEEVDSYMMEMVSSYITEGIMDRAVALGDTVDIDYEGKKDGVAFDGGTATGQKLGIGTGQFIDGFEDGLIGVMPGETVDLNLTFPEDYGNEELAGAAVVFTVKVNYIMPETIDDEIVKQVGIEGVETQEQLREYLRKMMEDYMASMTGNNKQSIVLETFLEGCDFKELPEDLLNKYKNLADTALSNAAAAASMTAAEYAETYYGQTDYDKFLTQYAEEALKQGMAMQAVANAENISISDEELDQQLLNYAQSYGMSTIEEFIGDNNKEDYRESLMFDKVLNFLIDNANISYQ